MNIQKSWQKAASGAYRSLTVLKSPKHTWDHSGGKYITANCFFHPVQILCHSETWVILETCVPVGVYVSQVAIVCSS